MEITKPIYYTPVTFPLLAPGRCCGVEREAFLHYSISRTALAAGMRRGYATRSRLVKLIWFVHRAHTNWCTVVDEGYKWALLPWAEIRSNLGLFTPDKVFFRHLSDMLSVLVTRQTLRVLPVPNLADAVTREVASGKLMPSVVHATTFGYPHVVLNLVLCEQPDFFVLHSGEVLMSLGRGPGDLTMAKQVLWNSSGGYHYLTDLIPCIAACISDTGVEHYDRKGRLVVHLC